MDEKKGYLILNRRVDESIIINDEIEIMVVGVKGKQVRFGIYAPKNIQVHRLEIWQIIQEEKGNAR